MKLPRRDNFCIWPRTLPRSRRCHASQGRKPIRRDRCAGSCLLHPVARPTSSLDLWVNGCRIVSASSSSSTTGRGRRQHRHRRGRARIAGRLHAAQVGSFNAVSATLYDKLSFNFIRDISPVASVVRPPRHGGESIGSSQDSG